MNTNIEGVILAGGRSTRMGKNKSLVKLHDKSLIEHVFSRLNKQVSYVSINTNEALKFFPEDIQFSDTFPDYPGPLAGIHAGLLHAKKDWVQFCPNDSPFLALNLVDRLSAYIEEKANIIVPAIDDKLEPVFMLCHRSFTKNIQSFILAGGRKMELWIKENQYKIVKFEDPKAFININNHKDLKKIES